MSNPTPADPDTHVVRVTREPRPAARAGDHLDATQPPLTVN